MIPFTYAMALAALVAALALRLLLDPFLGDSLPLVTLFGAVAAAVWTGGYGPALAVAVLGYVAASLLFAATGAVELAAYLFTCSLIVVLGEAMRRARLSASARGAALWASLAERQNFVTLVENSGDFIGMWDLAGKPFYVNPAGLRMLGLESMEEARRTHVRDFFLAADRATVMDELLPSVIEKGCGEMQVRFRNFRSGETRWMACKVLTLRNAAGQPLAFASVSQDVSERRQLEESLRSMAAEQSEANRRKNELLAMLAHELRNPLAPLSNTLQVLKYSGGSEAVRRGLAIMERQVGQLVRLVDDLLDASRITHGRLALRKGWVELAEVIEQAVQACSPLAQDRGHELRMEPASTIYLHADPARLVQVFANLLDNSCKHTPPGGRITISAERQAACAVITVEDTGAGIPGDKLESVFEIFTLMLAKRLVEMHGGSIEAASPGEGLGSRFTVRLPALLAEPLPTALPEAAASEPPPSRSVLVVDDNPDSAESLATLLQQHGHSTYIARDGAAALATAESHRPDVLLLNIGLPVLNGHEVCRRVREHAWGRHMLIIALTGWGEEQDRRKSRQLGFDGYLSKPVDYGALAELFGRMMPARSC